MPGAIFNQNWLASNGQRAFPLADWATRTDVSGALALPDDFLLDLVFPVPAGLDVNSARFLISAVSIYPTGARLEIGVDQSGTVTTVAVAVIPRAGHTEFQTYPLQGVNDLEGAIGLVTIGTFRSLDQAPAGAFTFNLAGGQLLASCLRPVLRAVSAIRVRTSGETGPWHSGAMELVSGANIRLTPRMESGTLVVRIDAISGAGLNAECGCEDAPGPPILTINGMRPDDQGNFTLLTNACLSVEATVGRLAIKDECSAPCCGSPEAEALAAELKTLRDERERLRNFVERLSTQVTTMDQVVLASRLGDQGCVT